MNDLDTRSLDVRRAVQIGLIAGVVGVYVCAIGMVEKFDERDLINESLTLGYLLLLLVPFLAGFVVSRRPAEGEASKSTVLVSAVVAGLASAALMVLFIGIVKFLEGAEVNVREIFISVSPTLLDTILLFGRGTVSGILLLVVASAILGLLGGAIRLIPDYPRRLLIKGLMFTILISLAESILNPILTELVDRTQLLIFEPDYLYEGDGLHLTGAVIVFVATVLISMLAARSKESGFVKRTSERVPPERRKVLQFILIAIGLLVLAVFPTIAGRFVSTVLSLVGLYVLLGLGLNIVVGYAGLLDLGYVAFFAIGAYSAAVLTSPASFLVTEEGGPLFADQGFMSFWLALPIIVVIAVVLGVAIGAPVLRLRGDYLAIVTLGFGEIIRTLVLSDWLKPVLGGAQGITRVPAPPPAVWELRDAEKLIFLIVAFCLLAAFISYRISDSRVGRAWIAMREDEQVAEAMGVSVIKYKLLAFAMGAGIACLGGAFFAVQLGSIFPNSFGLLVSINVLAVIILGGMGSIPGVVVGALVLVGLPEALREFQEFRLLLYGAILIAIMILRPEGLIPSKRRQLELHEEEILEEQFAHRTGEDTGAPVVVAGPPGPPGGKREER
jgi:branched-chain amino acid transport system permease protein